MKQPKLSFWQIWNMSFGFLGIQFGFGLQSANMSRIFETLGANIDDIPILWVAAPITGLLVQPIIGYFSDRTWTRLGRRRPYFLVGAILASLALFVMPNSSALWVAAGMLWILDASINISMEPFRAFVGDMLPSEQRTKGFAMQSFFIGIGAVVASALPYIFANFLGVSNTAPEGIIPDSVKWSFYLGGAAFLLAVVWTVVRSKEYSPEERKQYGLTESEEVSKGGLKDFFTTFVKMPKTMVQLAFVQFFSWFALFAMWIYTTAGVTATVYDMKLESNQVTYLQEITSTYNGKNSEELPEIKSELEKYQTEISSGAVNVTASMRVVKFFSDSTLTLNTETKEKINSINAEYNQGANWVGICFAVYNGFAAVFAFFLMWMARKTNRKTTHATALLIGGFSLAAIYFVPNPTLLLIPFVGIGLAWASILAMPYAILTGALPAEKMGVYMGIFNFFIVIPQILAASILGFFVRHLFNNEAIFALILGGVAMVVAALLVLFVQDDN